MNDIDFSNSFYFCTLRFDKYKYTDNRRGSPSHYFAYMLSGKSKIVTENQTVHINEGDFFYIPDNIAYQSFWYGNPEIKFVSLGFKFMPNFENRAYTVQTIPYSKEAAELFLALSGLSVLTARDIGKFYTLAGMLIPKMTSDMPCRSREIVMLTQKYLLMHPFAHAAEMAKNCAVSEAALYAAFKKSSDITPNEMKNRLLLEKAKDLLITTDKTIEDISNSLNFSSPSYFRKNFKQYFGMTPKHMRTENGI